MSVTLLVLAKTPVPGRVKTRLTPPYTPAQAAALAQAALRDTLDAVRAVAGTTPLLVLDGEAGGWLPAGMPVAPQVTGGLDARLGAAFDLVRGEPALLVGMDTPQLTAALLAPAVAGLARGAAFGPAADGGWWALGLAAADGDLLRGVSTSRQDTGRVQRARLVAAGLRVTDLPVLRDVDTASDAAQVAASCPAGRFARLLVSMHTSHRPEELAWPA